MLRSRIFRTSILIVIALAAVNPTLASVPAATENSSSPWMNQIVAWVSEITSQAGRVMDSAMSRNPFPEPDDEFSSQLVVDSSEDPEDDEGEVLPGVDPLG